MIQVYLRDFAVQSTCICYIMVIYRLSSARGWCGRERARPILAARIWKSGASDLSGFLLSRGRFAPYEGKPSNFSARGFFTARIGRGGQAP